MKNELMTALTLTAMMAMAHWWRIRQDVQYRQAGGEYKSPCLLERIRYDVWSGLESGRHFTVPVSKVGQA